MSIFGQHPEVFYSGVRSDHKKPRLERLDKGGGGGGGCLWGRGRVGVGRRVGLFFHAFVSIVYA